MTIALVCVAVGDPYRAFLPRWFHAVSALERKPDQIMVVTDDPAAAIATLGNAWLDSAVFKKATGSYQTHPQVLVNEAIASTNTDWVCKMDVDDVIFPHALTPLDTAQDCDVWMFGIQLSGQWLPARHATRADILKSPHNLVFSGSPFRRWVWERARYRDMICEDWMFWIDAAKNGARFQASPSIDYEYVIHGDNITLRTDLAAAEANVRSLR